MCTMLGWPLTGRAEELNIIAEVLSGTAECAGVAIAGLAGVGKTRLVREVVAAAAERGWSVRSVTGTAAAQAIPLGAFEQWIDHRDGQPINLVGAVISAITSSPGNDPVLVAVDDAHLLDDLSAFVLHQLVRRRAATVIATIRTGQPAPETVTALWKDAYLLRLDLQPLSRRQCDALLETVLGGQLSSDAAERMWDLTRGNVLFLHELVRQELQAGRLRDVDDRWQWTGPMTASPTLVDLVNLSIGAAPEPAVEVLDLVTVAEPLELVYLTELADPAAIEDAESRDLITVSNTSPTGVVRVAHPLYAEARRAQTGRMRAARLRGQIATVMRDSPPHVGSPDPLRLGLLWLDSDLPADPDLYYRAGLTALLRLDLPLTHRLAEAAVRSGAGSEAHLLYAHTLIRLGRADDAEQILNSLSPSDPQDAVWVTAKTLQAANMLFAYGRPEQSWALIDDALNAAPQTLVPQLLTVRAAQLAMAARPADAATLAESIDRSQLTALPATILACSLTIALGDLGRPRPATEAADEGMRLAANSPQAAYQAVALALVHADALVSGGCIEQACALAERVSQQWADIPRVPHTVATAIKGVAALAAGDLPTAQECLRAAVTESELRNDGSALLYLLTVALTEALARAGEIRGAQDAMAQMQRCQHPSFVFIESNRLLATAWVAAGRGRSTEAQTLAAQAADFARTHGQYAREVMCLQAAIQFGDHRHGDRLAELAGIVESPRASLVARWAMALGSNDGDVLLEVSRDLEEMGDQIAAADAAAHAAQAFQHHNRRGARLTASGRATRMITDCGATTLATRAAAMPLPLSNREREIATLVGDGLTNKQIADTLTMSVRTVEGHVYRACTKLGIANRTELAELITQFGAPDH